MGTDTQVITVATTSMLVLEVIKLLIRKLGKNPEFGFSVGFYAISLPVLNALVPFALVWLGLPVEAPTLGMGALDVVKYVILAVIGAAISLLVYNDGAKKLKEYAQLRAALKNGEAVADFEG